jgi:hypothetical protein
MTEMVRDLFNGINSPWWHSNKQQSGRGNLGKSVLQTLAVLDVTALTSEQLGQAVKLFDAMNRKELLPVHEIDNDMVRHELDERFVGDVLGLTKAIVGPIDLLRMKLAQEPSIRGQKIR